MKKMWFFILLSILTWANVAQSADGDDIRRVDSCLDAYSSHLKGERWSIYGGSAGVGLLICVTPGILIYPFFSSTLTTMNENKLSHIADAKQLLMESKIHKGKRLSGFIKEVKTACHTQPSDEEIIARLNALEEDVSYCRKNFTDQSGKKFQVAEPWSYNEILVEMIRFFK